MKGKIIVVLAVFLLAFGTKLFAQDKTKIGTKPAMAARTEPIKVGKIAPDFILSDQNGKITQLSKAKMPVVLLFYRGYW